MADDISSRLRTAEAARGVVTLAEENGPEAAGAVPAEVASGTVVVGMDEDIVDPEQSDTKLIGARVLPGLWRRLYGRKGEWQGWRRGRRWHGAVAAGEEEGGGAQEAMARA
jgi:hypothetical protein